MAGLTAEQINHHFIGAHHNRRVWDLSDQVGGEPPVQGPVALLSGHRQQSLEKRAIPAAFFPEPCADHLCRRRKTAIRTTCAPIICPFSFIFTAAITVRVGDGGGAGL